jgi:hypothetical protein
MANTKTLSVRVPIDVAVNIENLCKQRGITRNALLQECIASEGVVNVNSFKIGGEIEPLDAALRNILIGVGAVSTGTVVYHTLNKYLPDSWTDEQREMASAVGAIAIGVGVAYGLDKLTQKK